jgi:hypothetical protein
VQEQDVVEWVLSTGVGCAAKSAEEAAAVSREDVKRMRQAIDKQPQNNAVFEVAKIVTGTLLSKYSTGLFNGDTMSPTSVSNTSDVMDTEQAEDWSGCTLGREGAKTGTGRSAQDVTGSDVSVNGDGEFDLGNKPVSAS